MVMGATSPTRRTMVSAFVKIPLHGKNVGPMDQNAWDNLPKANLTVGNQYNAPHSRARRVSGRRSGGVARPRGDHRLGPLCCLEMAKVMRRSLNGPVGSSPSYFKKEAKVLGAPAHSATRQVGRSGVSPSFKQITGVLSETGKRDR